MPKPIKPAPLWRRFAASIYDGLLLLGLWMATLLLSLPVQSWLGLSAGSPWLQAAVFLIGLGFFGWFWTHGGQTLGMRAWRLQLRRRDGALLRWPIAVLRYAGMLVYWGLILTPAIAGFIARIPGLATRLPRAETTAAVAVVAILSALILRRFDPALRLPQDWLSGTEVVQLPENPSPPV